MWRKNWVIFYSPHDTQSHVDAYELLKSEGVDPFEVSIYNGTRALLQAMGVDTSISQVFHGTKYVGTPEELQTYIYTLKRIYGEKLDAR